MGGGHDHGLSAGAHHRWRLVAVFGMVSTFFAVELAYGIIAGSLALISDAGHMATDVVALGAALAATKLASRPDTTGRRTYGSYRAEVFASGFTVLLMLGVAVYVVVEAISRIGTDVEVQAGPMLVVGLLGLLVNVVSIVLLRGGGSESINIKGAYYEVVADAAGSVGVVVAGVLIAATGNAWWDTLVAFGIGIFVAVRAVILGREVLRVLGQHVPDNLDIDRVVTDLSEVNGVADVHDLHLWTLTSGMNVATAHLVLAPGANAQSVLNGARAALRDRHHIEHATLQVEATASQECEEARW